MGGTIATCYFSTLLSNMSELEILKSKLDENIVVEKLVERLCEELNVKEDDLYAIILDVIIIILDYTNQDKIEFLQRTTLINMIKDYYYLNGYDKKNADETADKAEVKIKSIAIGDTTTTFADTSSQITINGTTYNTGTIEFSKDALIEKYSVALNKYRRMRW